MTTQQLADRVTSIEADLNQIKLLLQQNLKITPDIEDPWMKHAGMFQDDPLFDQVLFDQVLEEIEIYRRELDADRPELHPNDNA
jgi:hypothetical protein